MKGEFVMNYTENGKVFEMVEGIKQKLCIDARCYVIKQLWHSQSTEIIFNDGTVVSYGPSLWGRRLTVTSYDEDGQEQSVYRHFSSKKNNEFQENLRRGRRGRTRHFIKGTPVFAIYCLIFNL